ncbi:MAG: ABC transporter substrate-binding protein [Lachnospiraceae bacterium]|nr:ABC transporter substrate-binding protein [Lachnospiraceae bacterium]
MMKKVLSFVLAAAMAATALTGCGNSGATEETKAAEAKTEAKAEESSDELVFKIGGIGPITGGAAIYGLGVQNATKLAAEEINAAGGINGYKVEVKFADDEHDPEKSVNAYNELKDWGMQALLGTVTSAPCIAVADKALEDNMFLLTPSGSSEDCIVNDNAFRVCFSDPEQGSKSAEYIGTNGLASKVAVIYDSSDPYSAGIYETFAKEAESQPFEIVAAEAFTADSKTDFTVQIQKAKDGGAELIFLPIYYEQVSLILDQANKIGYAPKFFGCDGVDGILSLEGFDTSLAEGVMLLTPFVTDENDASKEFTANYEAEFGGTPNQFAADAYDGLYAIKAAIEQANLTPDMSVSDLCEGLKGAMVEITLDGLTGEITWDASGAPVKEPKAMVIKDGAYTAM